MENKSKTIRDFVNFVCNGDYVGINDFDLILAQSDYKKYLIEAPHESQSVRA